MKTYSQFIKEAKEAKPPQEVLNKISRAYGRKHKGVNVDTSHSEKSGNIRVNQLWVPPNQQGKGVGYKLIQKAIEIAKNLEQKNVFLNVNRFNQAVDFYKRVGFSILKEENIEIGNGFLMEDYVMQLSI